MKIIFSIISLFSNIALSQVEFNSALCQKNDLACIKKEHTRVNSENAKLFKEKIKNCQSFSFKSYILHNAVKKTTLKKEGSVCKMTIDYLSTGVSEVCMLEDKDILLMSKGTPTTNDAQLEGIVRKNSICKIANNNNTSNNTPDEKKIKADFIKTLVSDFSTIKEACTKGKIPFACMTLEKGKSYQESDCKTDKTAPICKLNF